MALLTITSDLGTKDFYLAALKGSIITQCGSFQIVDISHSIKPFDIKEAAFIVRNAYRYFPQGTIHLVYVRTGNSDSKLLLSVVEGHYFLTFDTGVLSLLFERTPHETYQINEELHDNGALLNDKPISKVIELLLQEYRPSDFGQITTNTVNYRLIKPITSNGSIKGSVIYFDHYGNAVTNISRSSFDQFIGKKSFTIFANVGNTRSISKSYAQSEEGEMVCLFNTEDYLEVAINKGKAQLLLGLKLDSSVLVVAD